MPPCLFIKRLILKPGEAGTSARRQRGANLNPVKSETALRALETNICLEPAGRFCVYAPIRQSEEFRDLSRSAERCVQDARERTRGKLRARKDRPSAFSDGPCGQRTEHRGLLSGRPTA